MISRISRNDEKDLALPAFCSDYLSRGERPGTDHRPSGDAWVFRLHHAGGHGPVPRQRRTRRAHPCRDASNARLQHCGCPGVAECRAECGRPRLAARADRHTQPVDAAACPEHRLPRHILTRIGRPQIPTDPMLQSRCDVLIALRPDSAWTQAHDQKELAAKITKVVNELPGFESSYSQPIQTRMDEMVYGQGDRADVGIKILGTDMGALRQQAANIVQVLQGIKGAADVKAETTNGLPQLVVAVNRSALARFGISIADVNAVIDSAIGPRTVTTVNDGNVQIDVTVRLAEAYRSGPARIGRVLAPDPNGLQVPLSEVASIHNVDGPVQISRENEKRRITVTANVRGNDLGSFVQEAQQKIQSQVHLPPGYTLEYAGDYESLKSGRARLLTVIPIVLTAILGLLLIVFGRMRQALMIFTGIPLAISGGILALSLRHMPFSMTAAVGILALGGPAVPRHRRHRRPDHSTILSLFVLPTLYAWFEKDDDKKEGGGVSGKEGPGRNGNGTNGNGNGTNGNGFHRSPPEDHQPVPAPEGILVPAGERS